MSASAPPFSLAEFTNLVALALNTDQADRFSESFLQFDPDFLAPSNTPSSHCPPNAESPTAPTRSPPTSPWRMRTTDPTPSSTWEAYTPSRPRQILDKIKRQASAFVLRAPEAENQRSQAPPLQTIPTLSLYTGTHHLSGSSFFEDDDDDEEGPPAFTPYVPLASQYERAAAAALPTGSTQKNRIDGLSVFSRPSSDITSPPPSPNSARSISTTSSASPITPTTPLFGPRPSASSPDAAYNPRWSLCTDDSSSVSYQNHPFSLAHEESEHDPFAKGSVQVVRHSTHSQDYNYGYRPPSSPKRKSRSVRNRRTAPAPARPPPSGPLPTPPSATTASPHSESDNVWTRSLAAPGVTPSPSPHPSPTTQPNAKPKSRQKVLRIRVAPSTAFSDTPSSKVQDWTLSLPLDVAFPGPPLPHSPTSPPSPSQSPRVRICTRSFLSQTSDSSSDSHSFHSQCPSAWHPTPPPTAPLPLPPAPAPVTKSCDSSPSPPRSSISSGSSTSAEKLPHPPRTADSTASTDTNASASTDSTATIVPSAAQRERERTLAMLTSPEAEGADNDSMLSGETGPYYSARSSFESARRVSFGSAHGCRVGVRVNSGV